MNSNPHLQPDNTDAHASAAGDGFWRCADKQQEEAVLRESLEREFPSPLPRSDDLASRRQFLSLMGASLAMAGLQGCRSEPPEKIVPYVRQPEELVPGKPLVYATAMEQSGFGIGLLVESHMGRPTKIEGNPLHPASLGATDIFAQAEVLSLYDPDRLQSVVGGNAIRSWGDLLTVLTQRLEHQQASDGAGLRILTQSVSSPTLTAQLQSLLRKFPRAKWHTWEPVNLDSLYAGASLAWGEPAWPIYRLEQADVVLSLDCDFLSAHPGHLRYARDFMSRRREKDAKGRPQMNRLYAVESTPSLTGSFADHRLPARPQQVLAVAQAVAAKVGVDVPYPDAATLGNVPGEWIDAVARDLQRPLELEEGSSVVVAGAWQPPEVHALANAINHRLGSIGQTIHYTEPIVANSTSQIESITELTNAMRSGDVEMLVILEGNPAVTVPKDLAFAEAMDQVPFRLHQTLEVNETSVRCHWQVPLSHFLESWSDTRAFDGTVGLVQPLIAPLYRSRSKHELLAMLGGRGDLTGHELVREFWQEQQDLDGEDFEIFWEMALHDGIVPESGVAPKEISLDENFAERMTQWLDQRKPSPTEALELVFRPDPTLWDGRYANNAWLQELPKPLTTITWDNPALIGPRTADRLELQNNDVVELQVGQRKLEVPVWILPGQPDGVITLHLGNGRQQVGRVGQEAGFDTYALMTQETLNHRAPVALRKLGKQFNLAATNTHHRMGERDLIRAGTASEVAASPLHPPFMPEKPKHEPKKAHSLYPNKPYDGHQWGMSIDLGACTGCSACVIACQAENNIPVVGKSQVEMGREMHWIRVDNYYRGPVEDPVSYKQPVPCMHCENAPCEPVCPVGATQHSDDGLNQMIYNRCVGTRYCSNNCPYKVRRFNFFDYAEDDQVVLRLLQNPDVTVRSRGVMEKCTYCVQRISAARIEADKENRPIRDGEIQTACQQACPTEAIVFGDVNDPDTQVYQRHHDPLSYALLAHLNTNPRTRYLAAVRNPNPTLEPS